MVVSSWTAGGCCCVQCEGNGCIGVRWAAHLVNAYEGDGDRTCWSPSAAESVRGDRPYTPTGGTFCGGPLDAVCAAVCSSCVSCFAACRRMPVALWLLKFPLSLSIELTARFDGASARSRETGSHRRPRCIRWTPWIQYDGQYSGSITHIVTLHLLGVRLAPNSNLYLQQQPRPDRDYEVQLPADCHMRHESRASIKLCGRAASLCDRLAGSCRTGAL